MTSCVPSVEPPSSTINSTAEGGCDVTLWIACSIVAAALRQKTTTLTAGTIAASPRGVLGFIFRQAYTIKSHPEPLAIIGAKRTCPMTVNDDPRLARFLVSKGFLRNNPVTIVDVGARWGYNEEWKEFSDYLRVICIDHPPS